MKINKTEKFIELIPENKYITDLNENNVFEGICGKNINPDDYKDISDARAQEILKRLSDEYESEVL